MLVGLLVVVVVVAAVVVVVATAAVVVVVVVVVVVAVVVVVGFTNIGIAIGAQNCGRYCSRGRGNNWLYGRR